MIDILKSVMKNQIRDLVSDRDGWRGYFTTKRYPTLSRIYKYIDKEKKFRLCFHQVYDPDFTGEDSELHIHGWPIAVTILDGSYRMEIGKTNDINDSKPTKITTIDLTKGSYYDMNDSMVWHRVIPLTESVSSVMLNGPPWNPMPSFLEGAKEFISPMNDEQITIRLQDFRELLCASHQ